MTEEADPLADLRRFLVEGKARPPEAPAPRLAWWRRVLARVPWYSANELARRVESARQAAYDAAWDRLKDHASRVTMRQHRDEVRYEGANASLAEEVRAYRHRHRAYAAWFKANGHAEPPLAPLPGQRTTLEGVPPTCSECGRSAT